MGNESINNITTSTSNVNPEGSQRSNGVNNQSDEHYNSVWDCYDINHDGKINENELVPLISDNLSDEEYRFAEENGLVSKIIDTYVGKECNDTNYPDILFDINIALLKSNYYDIVIRGKASFGLDAPPPEETKTDE